MADPETAGSAAIAALRTAKRDPLGYPIDENGALVLPGTPQRSPAPNPFTGTATSPRRNYVRDNIRRVQEKLNIPDILPPRVTLRDSLPEDVFGLRRNSVFKSKMQKSVEESQRFMSTFRNTVARARRAKNPLANTNRDVYAPHFRSIWFPILKPEAQPDDPEVGLSYTLSGGRKSETMYKRAMTKLRAQQALSWPSASSKSRSRSASPSRSPSPAASPAISPKAKSRRTSATTRRQDRWMDAVDGIKSVLTTEAKAAQAREEPIVDQAQATLLLYSIFDRVIKIGHNFLNLKNALRARDSEKIGFVSWADFVDTLESQHWQFTSYQLQAFRACLEASNIVRPGAEGLQVVEYINFVLCIRSWQHHRRLEQQNISSPPDNQSHHADGGLSGTTSRVRDRSLSPRSSSPMASRRMYRRNSTSPRRGSRRQQRRRPRSIGITDADYPIDPVLQGMIGQTD